MIDFNNAVYLSIYFIAIIYFVMLGCYMLSQRGNMISTHGELQAKHNMTHCVGVFMLIWALQCFIYLPSIFLYGYNETENGYDLCFLIVLMLNTPAQYAVMYAIVQKSVDLLRMITVLGLPYLILATWYAVVPLSISGRLPVYIATVLAAAEIVYLLLRYAREYNLYVQRVRSEYSETTNREIFWSWSCFMGFAFQAFLYLLYQYYWSPVIEYSYMAFSIGNAAYLCYCVSKQKPLDSDVVEDIPVTEVVDEKTEEKAYFSVIEQKLTRLCEENLLYLEPDLTREKLCLRLSIGRTYLSLYLRSRGLTYYQYINSLRVDYAVRLMQDNPDMSIREISELSGFRSQTTFRKVFQEVMGCLPSEVRLRKESTD